MESNESYIDIPNMNPGLGNNFLVETTKWPMVPLGTDCQCDSNVTVMDAKEFNPWTVEVVIKAVY